MGHPADPGCDPYPSVWVLDAVIGLLERHGAKLITLDQCMFGGPTQKPTMLGSNLVGVDEGAVRCDGQHSHEKSLGKDSGGVFATRRLQTYPPGLC
eukprot:3975969-Pyramimonas_sp.AAC.1